jgi:PD-(D/E)XK endonuclease
MSLQDVGMASLKAKGDLAELKVATDILERGYRIAIPFGEDHNFDLILCRDDRLERVQVKHAQSDGRVIRVECRSNSLTKGKVKRIKRYTARTIDWLAVYDRTSDACYYVPASELGNGRDTLSLRLTPTENNQRRGIRYAQNYSSPTSRSLEMEPAGLEPAPSGLQSRRSPN